MSWRRTIAAALAAAFCLVALVVVFRSEGLPAVDAASSRATRWFVHQPTGRVVLADGYGGRALASLDVGSPGGPLSIAEGPNGAFVLNDENAEVRAIDTAALRLGPPLGVSALGGGRAVAGVSAAGLVVVDPVAGAASLLPASGEAIAFSVAADPDAPVLVAPDGAVWSLDGDELVRTTSVASTRSSAGTSDALVSLVGSRPLVLDREARRARLGDGDWQALPTDIDPSEIVIQVPGPPGDCGWIGGDDELWCVGTGGVAEQATVEGLDIDGPDRLAIAGSAAALVRRGPAEIARFDWRSGEVLDRQSASIPSDAALDVRATVDLIWIDDTAGSFVWSVHPWGMEPIDKNDDRTLELGENGEILDEGESAGNGLDRVDDQLASEPEPQEPDNNGIDDPPIAVDDLVTARGGSPVNITVTANDYDPDGEAIAVVDTGTAGHGSVEIANASAVVYNPEPGYAGMDSFEYTITDGDGTEDTAEVRVELLPPDAPNLPPIGTPDSADTGPGVEVVIDVLRNDVDPERDSLRIGSFSPPVDTAGVGTVAETVSATELPALKFEPVEGFEGTAIFSYRPVDVLGALGAEVEVRVEVARDGDENRPPVAGPDAVRLRRNVETQVAVLVNDVDRDGDRLELSVVEPLPDGLRVEVQGDQLAVTAGPGSADLMPFEYEIDDGRGHTARGAVLVAVISDDEPNGPPVVTADTGTAVVGRSVVLDVLANDTDPDQDPLTVTAVSQPDGDVGRAVALGPDGVEFTPSPLSEDDVQVTARFMYTVADGNGHEAIGEVAVVILPEALPEPPFARDDSTFTFVNTPVTVDVLRNDGDPSGERPSLVGTPGCPAGGRAIVTADNRIQYTPPLDEVGAFRCTYEVTNSQDLTDSASIIISVRDPALSNEPPEVVNDFLSVAVGGTISLDVTRNDSDPDGDDARLEVVSSTAPSIGSATRVGNVITFVAGAVTGPATIKYQVADEDGAISSGNLLVTVIESRNQPPVASSDSRTVTAPAAPVSFDIAGLVRDPDGPVSELNVSEVREVTSTGFFPSLSGKLVTIAPAADFVGTVVVEYRIRDADGLTDTAQLTVNVREPMNRAPIAVNDNADVPNGGSVTVPVLANDSDPDGNALVASIVSGPDPSLGAATMSASGAITFNATPGASGIATIGYAVSDGELTDDATLRLNVLACSDSAPVAQNVFLQTGYQQPVAVPLSSYATNGTVTQSSGPTGYAGGIYTPPAGENGNVTISYTVANGCRQTTTGTVTIDVNQQPMPQPLVLSIGKNDVREVLVSTLAGDSELLSIVSSTGAPSWVVTNSASLLIDPPPSVPGGTFTWTTTVTDPGGLRADVPISVNVVNQAPTAINDAVDASSGSGTFNIVANDTDPDDANATLRISSIGATVVMQNGTTATITVGADGRQITVNAAAAQGVGTVQYTIADPSGATATAVVTVTGPPIVTTTLPPTTSPPTTAPPTTVPPTTAPPSTPPSATTAAPGPD